MRTAVITSVALCSALYFSVAHAQVPKDYPKRPIRIIITVAPGGGSDITARSIAQKLTDAWGQQVIVDNRPGGNGIVGMGIGANATPDGYTLLHGTIGPVAVTPSLYSKLPYDPINGFEPVARGVSALNVLVVHPALPVHSVKDLITYAKANSGKLNFGSSGVGAADHLAGELFNTMAGVKMSHVPYKGGAPALVDTIAGSIQYMFFTIPGALQYVKSGRVRAIGVTSLKRHADLPEVQTFAETLPGYEATNWYAMLAPAGVPDFVVKRIHAGIVEVLKEPSVAKSIVSAGADPQGGTPEEMAGYLKSEIAKWTKVIKEANLVVK